MTGSSSSAASALWRRLDIPGHDACRLTQTETGWQLTGSAVFRHALGPGRIEYAVDCDAQWHSREGRVRASIADQTWDLRIAHFDERWLLDDKEVAGLEQCHDLDFGFTPATNLCQLRRIALGVGETADVPVAWLDLPEGSLVAVPQRYERRSETTYWYESATFGYSALLEIDASGFVTSYPRLWAREE